MAMPHTTDARASSTNIEGNRHGTHAMGQTAYTADICGGAPVYAKEVLLRKAADTRAAYAYGAGGYALRGGRSRNACCCRRRMPSPSARRRHVAPSCCSLRAAAVIVMFMRRYITRHAKPRAARHGRAPQRYHQRERASRAPRAHVIPLSCHRCCLPYTRRQRQQTQCIVHTLSRTQRRSGPSSRATANDDIIESRVRKDDMLRR